MGGGVEAAKVNESVSFKLYGPDGQLKTHGSNTQLENEDKGLTQLFLLFLFLYGILKHKLGENS